MDLLWAFLVLNPQTATGDEAVNVVNLQLFASKFSQKNKQQMLVGAFKVSSNELGVLGVLLPTLMLLNVFQNIDQQSLMQGLLSEVGEWRQLYPSLSKLADNGLTILVLECKL